MRILVTGAKGFIGQCVVARLEKAGHEVRATNRDDADIARFEDCLRVCEHIDLVVHCAGKAGAWGPYYSYYKANVLGTKNLLTASQQLGVRRFINLSSASIYFSYQSNYNLSEEQVPNKFSNSYAETKFLSEQLVARAHSETLNTLSLRPRGVIGAGDRNWLPRIIEMRKKNRLFQPGHGNNLVDFTSIENLVDAIEACIIAPDSAYGRSYNITNGEPERLWETVDWSLQKLGLDGKRKKVPARLAYAFAKLNERLHLARGSDQEPSVLPIKIGVATHSMTLNISAAKKHLGYNPRVSTKQAIKEFATWWKTQTQ